MYPTSEYMQDPHNEANDQRSLCASFPRCIVANTSASVFSGRQILGGGGAAAAQTTLGPLPSDPWHRAVDLISLKDVRALYFLEYILQSLHIGELSRDTTCRYFVWISGVTRYYRWHRSTRENAHRTV